MKNITRSFITTSGTVIVYDAEKKALAEKHFTIDGKFDDAACIKALENHGFKALDILNREITETLYGMPESSFITLGKTYSERSKENRGMVSKAISTNVYSIKVYAMDTKTIEDKTMAAASIKELEKNLPSNYKLLEVVSTATVENLVCMTVEDFKKNARPMIDHFHYKK